jgi:cobalamin-dependent methionine synthase I
LSTKPRKAHQAKSSKSHCGTRIYERAGGYNLGRDGFDSLKEKWPVFERQHRTLQEIIDQNWQQIPEAKKMRNNLVHGIKVYDLEDCRTKASAVLAALRTLHAYVMQDYGSDPWNTQPRPKAQLQWVL